MKNSSKLLVRVYHVLIISFYSVQINPYPANVEKMVSS